MDWNRFDLPERQVLYSSTERKGAYAEVLAPLRPRLHQLTELTRRELDGVGPYENPITDEWNELGHMGPGSVPRIWHVERALAQLVVSSPGWYIDIEDPISLQALRTRFSDLLIDQNIPDMDVSVIRGHDRLVTCTIAEWVSAQILADGSIPLGIKYRSRHGTEWECWATFPGTATTAVAEAGIDVGTDADLAAIAGLFNLVMHA